MKKNIMVFLAVITVGLLCGCSAKEDTVSNHKENQVTEKEIEIPEIAENPENMEETEDTEKGDSTEEKPVEISAEEIAAVEGYVWEQIPELEYYATYIDKKTDGTAYMIVEVNDCQEIVINDATENCYMIYVGEQRFDHRANWEWFYVKEDLSEVFWYNLVEDEVCSLETWRNTPAYIRFMNEEE